MGQPRSAEGQQTFDTRTCRRNERLAFWSDAICSQILPVEIDPRSDVELSANAMRSSHLGDLQLREVIGGRHVYTRTSQDIRRGDPQTLQVGLQLAGHALLVQDGREAVLEAGDLVLYDSSRPFTLAMEERFSWQVFLLPKARLRRSDREISTLTATRISGDSGVAGLASRFLRDLVATAPTVATSAAGELAEVAADVIAALVRSETGKAWNVTNPQRLLIDEAMAFVTNNLGNPQLGPDAIAHAIGVSTRRLHQLFEASGRTVCEHIREERLDALRRDLSDARLAHVPVSRLAAEWGIRNPSLFSRIFREATGETPSEFRARAMRGFPPRAE